MKPGPREIGFAIVGTGTIAAMHARGIAATPGTKLRAVHNRTADKAQAFAKEFGGEPVVAIDALLTRNDVDIVCITTPSGLHGELAIAALEAGKHVLCEKPLEITTARVDAMIAAAQRTGRILAGVFQLRFGHGAQQLKSAIDAGRFGRLALCSAYVKWWRTPEYYSSSNWKGTKELDGGGALMNQAIHGVDLLQWLVGMPARLTGTVRTRVHPIAVEDTAAAVLEFGHGALGVIEAATSCYPGSQLRIEISGEKGTAVLENDRIITWQFATPLPGDDVVGRPSGAAIGGGASDPKAIGFEGHRRLVDDIVQAVRNGTPPAIPSADARNAVAIIEAIYASSRQSVPVSVS